MEWCPQTPGREKTALFNLPGVTAGKNRQDTSAERTSRYTETQCMELVKFTQEIVF